MLARNTIRSVRLLILAVMVCKCAAAAEPGKVLPVVEQVCATCHGLDGNSTTPTIPKLAGRHPEYLLKELKDFKDGARKSDVMNAIAPTIASGDLKEIANYFARQKPTSGAITDAAAAALGEALFQNGDENRGVPACAGCHETDGSGNKRFPRLAGQHREYLTDQMLKFKTEVHEYVGTRRYMRDVTKLLSEAEIKAVAEYLSAK
jgi:cytochrome c553